MDPEVIWRWTLDARNKRETVIKRKGTRLDYGLQPNLVFFRTCPSLPTLPSPLILPKLAALPGR